ncbi:1,6-anhydro-N-acetylmuramyl-L-alanine amidase AmpD [Marinimicrobium alkaliphilum]|uniref:1,6-anhydro-N-acetylmuramyl-L-alanine amidase AmpD n=1 Tax=Marinimicrobium alkaliphilum TaxID=2202654 RepID=UPI001E3AD6C5|nr:1,6-anhydro-N-acetylmuramyl-L-alanine amidase AmpD [Marinimicrobium alkaliphilum]
MSRDPWGIDDGWLRSARLCPSPNCNDRPAGVAIDLLVVHNISLPPGQFGTGCVQRFFCNQLPPDEHPYFVEIAALKVSAHLLIERTGALTQFVPFERRAWHAGQSRYRGRENCNDFSIGVELEGTDEQPYTEAQYQQLSAVARTLMRHYPGLSADRITGHADIAPGRKTDPGSAFDWSYFRQLLAV